MLHKYLIEFVILIANRITIKNKIPKALKHAIVASFVEFDFFIWLFELFTRFCCVFLLMCNKISTMYDNSKYHFRTTPTKTRSTS